MNMSKNETIKLLKNVMEGLKDEMVIYLKEACPYYRGDLKDSIHGRVENDEIIFDMDIRAKFLEFGTAPHWAPIQPLMDWAEEVLGDARIGYAIQKHIAENGTEMQPFIRTTFRNKFKSAIEKAIKKQGVEFATIRADFQLEFAEDEEYGFT